MQDLERALVAADRAGNTEDATRLANAIVTMRSSQHKPIDPTDEMNLGQRALAGFGKAFVDPARGIGQALGMVSQKEVDDARSADAPLMKTGGGVAGNILGSLVPAAATLAIPGAGGVLGAGLVSGAFGAAQPTSGRESRLENTADGLVLGMGAQAGIGKAAKYAGDRLAASEARGVTQASQNTGRDAALKAAQAEGYVVAPSQVDGSLVARILEGLSGQAKTKQNFSVKNENVTERLSRKALALPADAPLTTDATRAVREAAFIKGYEPVMRSGQVTASRGYGSALDTIVSSRQGAANSFPNAVKNEVAELIDGLRVPSFDAGDAVKMTRVLREDAGTSFATGKAELGRAQREAAKVLENEIEQHLSGLGKDGAGLLKEFRDARTLMARAHEVERALIKGGGRPDARAYGAALSKGRPLTGELKTMGQFAQHFGEVAAVPKAGWSNPFSMLDFVGGAALSPALPAARVGARSAIGSAPFQRNLAPQYGPGLLEQLTPAMLEELKKRGVGGLAGLLANPAQ